MKLQFVYPLVIASVLGACPDRVQEFRPSARPLNKEVLAQPAIAELTNAAMGAGLPEGPLTAPDGSLAIELHADRSWFNQPSGFFEVVLRELDTGKPFPLFSFWEGDAGSGPSLWVRWSAKSDAVRFVGSTPGYERGQQRSQAYEFNLLFVVRDQLVYDLGVVPASTQRGASPSNNAFQPTVSSVTPRAEHASRQPAGG